MNKIFCGCSIDCTRQKTGLASVNGLFDDVDRIDISIDKLVVNRWHEQMNKRGDRPAEKNGRQHKITIIKIQLNDYC